MDDLIKIIISALVGAVVSYAGAGFKNFGDRRDYEMIRDRCSALRSELTADLLSRRRAV